MMFELERFFALRTFELAKHRTFVVAYHVPLETVHVGECFVAYFARLHAIIEKKKRMRVIRIVVILIRLHAHIRYTIDRWIYTCSARKK